MGGNKIFGISVVLLKKIIIALFIIAAFLFALIFVKNMINKLAKNDATYRANIEAWSIYKATQAWLSNCKKAGYETDFTFLSDPVGSDKMLSADPFDTGIILPDFTFADYLSTANSDSGNTVVYIKNGEVIQVWWAYDGFNSDIVGGYPHYVLGEEEVVYQSINEVTIESLEPFMN